MGGEDLLTIIDQWSRSLSPPRSLLDRLLVQARAANPGIFDLRLFQHDTDILTPIAAAVTSESGAIRLDTHPALAQALTECTITAIPPDRYIFPAVVDPNRKPSYLLEVAARGGLPREDRGRLMYMARMIAQALELRDLRAMAGFNHALTAMAEPAQEVVSTRLHRTLSGLMSARDLSQMAGIIARDLLSGREVLTLNQLDYDASGTLTGWHVILDNSGVANPRRELRLDLPWGRIGAPLREAIQTGEPFILNALGPEEKPLAGPQLFEWMQAKGIASAAFYPISHPTRTSAVLGVLSTVQRTVSEAAVQSFVKLAERIALLTQYAQQFSAVTMREYWAQVMLRTSQQLLDAQEYVDITGAAIDALPPNVRLTALALFDVPVKTGYWPDWLRIEALSSRTETRTLPGGVDRPRQQDRMAHQFIAKLMDGIPVLDRLETGTLRYFAENLAATLAERGCSAAVYIGLVADESLYGLLVLGAEEAEALDSLAFVLRDMSSAVSQSVRRLMAQKRQRATGDLSHLLEFSRSVMRARSEEELMFAVRDCLSGRFATVAWVNVSVNRLTRHLTHAVISQVLRDDRAETFNFPLHEEMDDEQFEWFHRKWLSPRRYGSVVHHDSESELADDPVLRVILRDTDEIYSAVALPLMADNQLEAQVYVAFQSAAHEATPEYLQLCSLVRDQLSLKVMSMRETNTNQADNNAALLQVINDLAVRLLTVRDERMLLTEGARSFATALGVDHAGVTILREDGSADVVAEYPDAGLVGLNIPPDNPYLVMTVRDRVPLPVEDVRTDSNLTPENREALAASGIRKMLFLPMLDQNQACFGSIGLDVKREDYEFDLNMVEIARTLTNQLAMLYLSLRQLIDARRHAEQLAAMTDLSANLVSAQRDDDIYLAVAHQLRDILPADDLWILMDTAWLNGQGNWPAMSDHPSTDDVQVVMQYEGGVPNKPAAPITFMLEDTPAGKAHGDELVHIADLSNHTDLRPLLDARRPRAVLAAPIRVSDRIVGVLEIDSREPGIYTANDQAVFAQLASQVSSALDRARSLHSSQRTAKTQEIAATFANRVQSAGTHQKTMTEAARSYQGLLHANQVNIQLGQPPSPSQPPADANGNPNGSTNGSKGDKR